MVKKCYRFYAGLMRSQARFLNRMASEGYRLIHTDKLLYEFEDCEPNAYEYCVEYVGDKTSQNAEEYKRFLEDMGYHVFFKNINLNYSSGKIYYRPWAEKGGKLGTSRTTLNKELLLIEKPKDGKPFELHTTYEDRIKYMKSLRNPWLCLCLMFLLFLMMELFFQSHSGTLVFGIFILLMLIPVVLYQLEIRKLTKESKTKEW